MTSTERLSLVLRAEVAASEDAAKVLAAARNALGECDCQVEQRPNAVIISSSDRGCLQKIHDQLRDRHVRDAARRLLLKSSEGNHLRLLLNRQAAYVGIIAVVSTGEESPLGPLVLEMDSSDPQALIDWLTFYQTGESRQPSRPSQPRSP